VGKEKGIIPVSLAIKKFIIGLFIRN
jgi:hypothetical protein